MQWSANVLAQAVLDAGLTGRDAAELVAIGLAATGGNDAFYERAPLAPVAYCGAFGAPYIDNATGATWAPFGHLWEQAKHAVVVYQQNGGVFDAFPSFRNKRYRRYLTDAWSGVDNARRGDVRTTIVDQSFVGKGQAAGMALANAHAKLIDALNSLRTYRP